LDTRYTQIKLAYESAYLCALTSDINGNIIQYKNSNINENLAGKYYRMMNIISQVKFGES